MEGDYRVFQRERTAKEQKNEQQEITNPVELSCIRRLPDWAYSDDDLIDLIDDRYRNEIGVGLKHMENHVRGD